MKFIIYLSARHIESRDFSRVGRIAHAVVCLHHLLPYVGNIGTNGITNGTIGKTLNGICLPMVSFLPLEKTTNARIIWTHGCWAGYIQAYEMQQVHRQYSRTNRRA